MKRISSLVIILFGLLNATIAPLIGASALAADTDKSTEDVDVGNIKQRYWARGEETELDVVQNRLYSQAGKLELGAFGGVDFTDPFLSVQEAGALVGYHFTEYFGVEALAWKYFSAPSSALNYLQGSIGATANTNNPYAFYGGEANWSLIYGKLSVLGKSIIYYDLHLLGGGGITQTESGDDATFLVGLGQQFYITKLLSLRVDYRLMTFNEGIIQKANPLAANYLTVVDTRQNWSNVITLGLSFLIGG